MMYEDMTCHAFFPTPVWIIDLKREVFEPLNRKIVADLYALLPQRPNLQPGGTFQTDTDLHTFEEFAEFMDLVRAGARGVLKFLKVENDEFEITGSWANINPPTGVNTPHAHPNNFLSGVYYVQTSPGADEILFSDPRSQASVISPKVTEETIFTGNEISVPAREGRMIFFPAWLVHGVPANKSRRDRISISYNIMFPSLTQTIAKPKWEGSIKLKRRQKTGAGTAE